MPKRRPRFSALDKQLRALGGSPPPDGKLGKYNAYRLGQRRARQTNKVPLGARVRRSTSVLPFAITEPATAPVAANYYVVSLSEYSYAGLNNRLTTLSKLDLGWAPPTTGNIPLSQLFYPALMVVRCTRGSNTVANDKVSDITGETYKYAANRNFGIPFGRLAATPNNDYTTQRTALSTKTLAIPGVRGISFQNEVLRAAGTLKSTEDPFTPVPVT